jgi:molybdenum cofactor synthesis domain-containing protein
LIGILTVSDTRNSQSDQSGPAIRNALGKAGFTEFTTRLATDDIESIQQALIELCESCIAVFTTGGTGFTSRDVTPEATGPLLDRMAESLVELTRLRGLAQTPLSHLSRGIAGMRGSCLVINLPGSPKGAEEGIEALVPLLPHIFSQLRGDGCGHPC